MNAGMSQGQPQQDRETNQQFQKTKMCKFELVGICSKGANCQFAHSANELRQPPDLSCTKLCKTLILTGRCDKPGCTFAHNKDELRATDDFQKTKLCKFWQD